MRVGLVGCGKISGAYLEGAARYGSVELVACSDLDLDRARATARAHRVPRACSVHELLADPAIELVLNLTVPRAHTEVNLAALEAGKHVYAEKPLALSNAEAAGVLAVAERCGLRVGCAPDTFLGGALQTARGLIDAGAIGEPVAATAFMAGHGHESWHPSPAFYYEPGGGPMLDMGPYHVTALVALLGPVRRVTGSARASLPERVVTSAPLAGTRIPVNVPTHYAGVADFAAGAVCTLLQSFDVWRHSLPHLEVHGTEGSLSLPDPNGFGGPVRLARPGGAWEEVPPTHPTDVGRGIGLAEMAASLAAGRPHRVSGGLARHVLEVLCAVEEASVAGSHVVLESSCERPEPLPPGGVPR